jgi:hypothetical protein
MVCFYPVIKIICKNNYGKGKSKGKFQPRAGHEGPNWE